MFESTNALIGALIAVMREVDRCDALVGAQTLPEEEEEDLGDYMNQLQEALSDMREAYEARLPEHPTMLPYAELRARVKAQQAR
jgi:hypothetical protein